MAYDGTLKFDTAIDSSGFQAGISKISGIASKGIKATAAVIAGAATAVTGFAASAVKAGGDFEAGMSKVQAISGASGDDMVKLSDKAKEMGAKTKFSASESAEAFQYMAMAGWKTNDMLGSIEGVMNLAAASGEDLGRTSDIVTDAMTAFGLAADGTTTIIKDGFSKEVSNATHFADVLAKSASNSNTNVSMLGESFKYVAPVAGSLGYNIEDTSIALGLMANQGIKASTAGTALRQLLTNMAKPTDKMADAMDYLGISLSNSNGSMKSLKKIMDDLRKSFGQCKMPMEEYQKQLADLQSKYESGQLTEKKYNKYLEDLTEKAYGAEGALKAKYAATLAGQEGMSGLLAIVNTSAEDYDKLTESIYNADGAAKKMADTMNDNLQGAITLAKSALESVQISLYEKVQEPMKDTVKALTSMLEDMNSAIAEKGFDGFVEALGNSIAELAEMGMNAAPKLIGIAENLVGTFINAIMDHQEEFAEAGATVVSELIRAILNVAGDMWSAGIYLFTEFLQAMTDHSEEIGQSFGEMLGKIGEAVKSNLPLIIQAAKDFMTGFCEGLSEEFPGISALLEGFFQGFFDTAGNITEEVVNLVENLFSVIDSQDPAAMEEIGKAIGTIAASIAALSVASSVLSSVKSLFSILGILKGGVSGLTGVIGKVIDGFALWKGGAGTLTEVLKLEFPAIEKAIAFVSKFCTSIAGIGSIIAGAILAVTNFVDMFKNGFNAVKDILMGIGIALAAVGAVILGAPAAVAAVVAGIVYAVANLVIVIKEHWDQILEFIQQIPEKVGEIVDAVVTWFEELPGRISEFLSQIISAIQEWGSKLLEAATQAVSTAIDAVVHFFSELPYKIGYALGFVIGKLVDFGKNAINWVKTNIPIIIENIVNFFSQLPGKVWNWLTETFNKIVTWGSNTLQKAREIASNTVEAIVNFFSQLPGKIWNWLSNALQKVTEWGTELAEKGIQAASSLCNAVLNGIANLPSQMVTVGYNIVTGVWNGICNAAGWFESQVRNFFSGIVDGVKSALGIHSPSRVFADEVGQWIPPGIGEGIEDKMPDLYEQMDTEMSALGKRMQMAVKVETGKIAIDKNANTTYKVVKEKQGVFDSGDTTVEINGETHVHVDLDGKEVGRAQAPIVDRNLARIDSHKKRGG